jgi:hypothetical protein
MSFGQHLRALRDAAVETKYRCRACGQEWKVRAAA